MAKNKTETKTKRNSRAKKENGLGDAMGINTGFPFNQGTPFSQQIENVNTVFKNLRWYLVSNMRQVLSQLYIEIGLVQTIVDVPVEDALRGGVEIHSKQLDEDQLEILKNSIDRDDDLNVVGQAAKWNRLFGGAGVLIMTDQDPESELDMSLITEDSPLEFRAVDMWELFWDKQNTEGYDPQIQTHDFEFYSYYGIKLHKSRVMRLKGLTAPSFIRPRLRGWGFSIVEKLVRSLNQYLKATDLGFEVLDQFKLDVYRVKGLNTTLLSPNGTQKVQQRFQLANMIKNYQNALVMDVEDEYDHKQLSFAGIAEAMLGIRQQVASDMRMPMTKLFGISATGFNSGEDDIEVYNAMVESEVRNKIKYDLLRMIEIKCQKLFGMVPEDLAISFKPLRMLSAEQEENVKTQKFQRLLQAKQSGELTTYEFREGINKGKLLDITLDNNGDALNPQDPDVAELVEGGSVDPLDSKDVSDPGANREDTRKPRAWDSKAPNGEGDEPKRPGEDNRPVHNSDKWDESKHPRADDGKFGKGGGGSSADGKKDKKPAKKAGEKKSFKSFETKVPERQGMKSKSIDDLTERGGRGYTGKKSINEYKSPSNSTCNLVGYVALGKATKKAQEEITEAIQCTEVVLTALGIKLKTPLDFVCQSVSSAKQTVADISHYGENSNLNPRINLKSKKDSFSKSILHEVGHGIDYALSETKSVPSSRIHTKGHSGDASKDIQSLHKELVDIVKSSDFYEKALPKYKAYLSKDTEIFARAFEVYSYGKAVELANDGKIPESFLDGFKPDVFKTRDERAEALRKSSHELALKYRGLKPEDKDYAETLEQWKKVRSELEDTLKENQGYVLIPEESRGEYIKKITKAMGDLLSKDSIKNALIELGFLIDNSLQFTKASYEADGGDNWMDHARAVAMSQLSHVTESHLWMQAKEESNKIFGKYNMAFSLWYFKKLGGRI